MDPKQTDGATFEDMVQDLFDPVGPAEPQEETEEEGAEKESTETEGEENDQ